MNFSFLLLKRLILFLFMCLCVYVDFCVGTHRSMKKVSIPWSWSCQSLIMGSGKKPQVLFKNSKYS